MSVREYLENAFGVLALLHVFYLSDMIYFNININIIIQYKYDLFQYKYKYYNSI